jgi:hypothetical protein
MRRLKVSAHQRLTGTGGFNWPGGDANIIFNTSDNTKCRCSGTHSNSAVWWASAGANTSYNTGIFNFLSRQHRSQSGHRDWWGLQARLRQVPLTPGSSGLLNRVSKVTLPPILPDLREVKP